MFARPYKRGKVERETRMINEIVVLGLNESKMKIRGQYYIGNKTG